MAESTIEVYAVGSTVLLGDVISAQVVTVEISENGVRFGMNVCGGMTGRETLNG